MAQTIALQRGSTTVTGNGTSYATLFTQSGGAATRVILNSVSCYSAGNADTQIRAGIFIKAAGSSTNVFTVAFKSFYNSTLVSGFDFSPMMEDQRPITMGGVQTNTASMNYLTLSSDYNTPTATFGGQQINQGNVSNSTGYTTFGSNGTYDQLCTNFWIGPSDVVCVKVIGNNQPTWNVVYSFTTITET